MSDENKNAPGLFPPDGGLDPSIVRLKLDHRCAKCGTGYATDQCQEAERLRRWIYEEPGSVTKVGPPVLPRALTNGENVIQNLLDDVIGEDSKREGLRDTPARVVKAWAHWTSGYAADIPSILKTFSDGAEGYDEMVVRKNIRIYSHCEHHLAPIIGDCTIAYIPNGRVVGLSKLDRLADAFSRRLQVQERLTTQIADALMEHLEPRGVGVYISARHMCIESRGVSQHSSDTVTSALRGVMKTQPETRAEFMALVKG